MVTELNTITPQAQRDVTQQVQAKIAALRASGALQSATVQYRYANAPDGTLVPVEAVIRSEQVKDNPAPLEKTTQKISGIGGLLSPASQSTLQTQTAEPVDPIYGLTADEQRAVQELRAEDLAVRIHEAQHFRAAGGLTSGTPEYTLVEGPDGKQYAVGGVVDIRTSASSDPAKQARDAQALYSAATGPADASAQDISVAQGSLTQAQQAYNALNTQAAQYNGITPTKAVDV